MIGSAVRFLILHIGVIRLSEQVSGNYHCRGSLKQSGLLDLNVHPTLRRINLNLYALLLRYLRMGLMTAWSRVVKKYISTHSYWKNCISDKDILRGIAKLDKLLFGVFPPLLILYIRMFIVAAKSHRMQIANGIVRNTIHDRLPVFSSFIPWFKWQMLKKGDWNRLLRNVIITQKDIVVVSVIATRDIGVSGHCCLVREVVRRNTGDLGTNDKSACKKIMSKSPALSHISEIHGREEQIMIDHIRAMANLNEEVFRKVVKKYIAADAGALCLPVKPKRTVTAIDFIFTNLSIQGSMQFNSCYFGTVSEPFMVNIVNTVLINAAEGCSHMTHNTGLFAIMNHITSNDVTADPILMPAGVQRS